MEQLGRRGRGKAPWPKEKQVLPCGLWNPELTESHGAPAGHTDFSAISSEIGTVALPAKLAGCWHWGTLDPAIFYLHHGKHTSSSMTTAERRRLGASHPCGKGECWEARVAGLDSTQALRAPTYRVRRDFQGSSAYTAVTSSGYDHLSIPSTDASNISTTCGVLGSFLRDDKVNPSLVSNKSDLAPHASGLFSPTLSRPCSREHKLINELTNIPGPNMRVGKPILQPYPLSEHRTAAIPSHNYGLLCYTSCLLFHFLLPPQYPF